MPSFDGDAIHFRANFESTSTLHPGIRDNWKLLVKGKLDVISVPGTHDEIIKEPCARVLAAELEKALGRANAWMPDKALQTGTNDVSS